MESATGVDKVMADITPKVLSRGHRGDRAIEESGDRKIVTIRQSIARSPVHPIARCTIF
jgi:hypothetical protein